MGRKTQDVGVEQAEERVFHAVEWSGWWARGASLVTGSLLALAFPRPGAWWLAFVALAPVLLLWATAPSAREAGLRAWLGGAAFFLAVHHWLLPVVGPFALPLAAALGVLWVPPAVLARRLLCPPVSLGRLAAALVVIPSAWVAGEAVRSWEHLGGPWALLGASQWSNRPVLAFAAVAGVWGVSWLLVAANVGLAALLLGGTRGAVRAGGAVVATAAVLTAVVGGRLVGPGTTLSWFDVAIVQPGRIDTAGARLDAHASSSRALNAPEIDLVVWGESSVGFDPDQRVDVVDRIADVARSIDADLLVNVDARRGAGAGDGDGRRAGIFKSSLLVAPDGPRARYDKTRLVPFGEYIPLRSVLGWVERFTDAATEDRRRGSGPTVMPASSLARPEPQPRAPHQGGAPTPPAPGAPRIGPLVCFESAFPDLTREVVDRGADIVVVQSATTTFQGSWAQPQHASLAAVRAVETARPVVHVAVSGVSAAFDARGRRLAWLEPGPARVAVVPVPVVSGTTPYVRFGDWLARWSIVVAAVGWAATARLGRSPSQRRLAAGALGVTIRWPR